VAVALLAIAVPCVVAVYVLRLDRVVGLYTDDAWYVLLAKALASGAGYTLINSPSPGILPLYPPGFPALLSLVFRLAPQFPENVAWLKAVSVVAMLGVGAVTVRYFTRERGLSLAASAGLALATVLHPGFVFLATSTVMSECAFALLQWLTVVAVERTVRRGGSGAAAMSGALASLAFLTRTVGVAVPVAAFAYLVKERRARAAAVFGVLVALLAGSWTLYAGAHAPTAEQRAQENTYVVDGYATAFWSKTAAFPNRGAATVADLPMRVWENTRELAEYDCGALGLYPVFRAVEPSEWVAPGGWRRAVSLAFAALAAVGFAAVVRQRVTLTELLVPATLVITVLWPAYGFRFVLPLLPVFLFYVVTAVEQLACRLGRAGARLAGGLVLTALAAVSAAANAGYLWSLAGPPAARPSWIRTFDANHEMLLWVATHLPADALVVSPNPALVFLYTGRKALGSRAPGQNWERWQRLGVRYAVITGWRPLRPLRVATSRYPVLYRSAPLNLVVLDFGDASSRLPWLEDPAEALDWFNW